MRDGKISFVPNECFVRQRIVGEGILAKESGGEEGNFSFRGEVGVLGLERGMPSFFYVGELQGELPLGKKITN